MLYQPGRPPRLVFVLPRRSAAVVCTCAPSLSAPGTFCHLLPPPWPPAMPPCLPQPPRALCQRATPSTWAPTGARQGPDRGGGGVSQVHAVPEHAGRQPLSACLPSTSGPPSLHPQKEHTHIHHRSLQRPPCRSAPPACQRWWSRRTLTCLQVGAGGLGAGAVLRAHPSSRRACRLGPLLARPGRTMQVYPLHGTYNATPPPTAIPTLQNPIWRNPHSPIHKNTSLTQAPSSTITPPWATAPASRVRRCQHVPLLMRLPALAG